MTSVGDPRDKVHWSPLLEEENFTRQQQEASKDINENDRLLKNGELFNVLRGYKGPDEKLKKLEKLLNEGANINAPDANQKNNTPLHISVLKGEREITKFLLHRGAIIGTKNNDNKTPLDIAKLPNTPNGNDSVNILEHYLKISNQLDSVKQSSLVNNFVNKSIVQKQPQNKNQQFLYLKRSGTAGIGGQHYETKLTMLFLLRGKSDNNIEQFYLGTNVAEIGVFDDIVFRYKLKEQDKPKALFIQAKHRDNPNKDRVTVEDFRKATGDFYLFKLFDSYLQVMQKFHQDSEDIVFKDDFENVDCHFVIYTPAKDNFGKEKFVKQLCASTDDLIHISEEGKIFQFSNYDNEFIDPLVGVVSERRAKQLAKCLAKFILSENDNSSNMMSNKLIKTHHVFLSQNVMSYKSSEEIYCEGKFLSSFFDNTDKNLLVLKETLCEEIVTRYKKSTLSLEEKIIFLNKILANPSADSISTMIGSVLKFDTENSRLKFIERDLPGEIVTFKNYLEKIEITKSVVKEAIMIAGRHKLQSLSFKLPRSFGNLNFNVRGGEERIKRRLNYLSGVIINLLERAGDDNIVSINDDIVGTILQKGDIETSGGIGGLVGNLLILDEETNLLKFNTAIDSLPINAKQLFYNISDYGNLSSYRFKIDLNKFPFPSLSLVNQERDAVLIRDFLSKFKIYTNQKKEDEIENILKGKINTIYNIDKKKNEFPFPIKNTNTIFLRVHDKIQKWWKKPQKGFYLTQHCEFFEEARQNIDFLNATCVNKFQNDIIFNQASVDRLGLDNFLKHDFEQILYISSDKILLSCNKLNQYFNFKNHSYTFIELDYVIKKNYYGYLISELKETKCISTLIIVCDNVKGLRERVEKMSIECNKKIIVVANKFAHEFGKYIIKYDENNLTDLSFESQQQYLEKGIVMFQGKEVSLGTIVDDGLKYVVGAKTLCKLINNENISIGKPLTNSRYEDIKNFYVKRNLYRHLTLKTDEELTDFIFTEGNQIGELAFYKNDILLISDCKSDFTDLCCKYKHHNIHWFQRVYDDFVWQESQGSLKKLFRIVFKLEYSNMRKINKSNLLKSNKDIDDRIVIVGAEPGMGKSILITHLSIETKMFNPSLWVIRIDLRDYATEFCNWQNKKRKIDELEVIKFLYKAVNFQAFEENQKMMTHFLDLLTIENNEIDFGRSAVTNIAELALLEIQVFTYCYNQGKVILLLDGVDEVLPNYRKQIIDLLDNIEVLKIKKLWITTRCYNIQEDLERTLNTFSHSLKPFSPKDQKYFLKGFWKNRLNISNVEDTRFNIFADALFRNFSKLINDVGQHFTSLPLYLYIIAENLQQTFKEFYTCKYSTLSIIWEKKLHKDLNLDALYERFVKNIFNKSRFIGKNTNLNTDEPDLKGTIEKEYQYFIEDHKILGAYFYILLSENQQDNILSTTEINKVKTLIEQIKEGVEKSGIIDRITVYNTPQFVHHTFAEYFLALFFSDKAKSSSLTHSERHFLFYQIFGILIYRNVRAFFVSKLATDSKLARIFELLLMKCITSSCNDAHLKSAVRILLYNTKGVSKDNRDKVLNWAIRMGDMKIISKLSDC